MKKTAKVTVKNIIDNLKKIDQSEYAARIESAKMQMKGFNPNFWSLARVLKDNGLNNRGLTYLFIHELDANGLTIQDVDKFTGFDREAYKATKTSRKSTVNKGETIATLQAEMAELKSLLAQALKKK